MPLPGFCHHPTGLEILAQARANPRESLHLKVLADWLEGLGVGMAGKFARIIRKSLATNTLLLVNEKYAEKLHPLVGFRRGWPQARNFDQTDPVAVAWLSTPDIIPIAPGNFIEMVRVPLKPVLSIDLKPFLISKTVITKRQWHAYIGRKLPINQNPLHPVTNIPSEKAQRFCDDLSTTTDLKIRLPTIWQWENACWPEGTGFRKKLLDDRAEMERHAWTRDWTPIKNNRFLPQEVCAKMPNPWGVFDMCGLVTEWCKTNGNYEAKCVKRGAIKNRYRYVWCNYTPFEEGIRIVVDPE